MTDTTVYFTDARARAGRSILDKLGDLFAAAGGDEVFSDGDRVAVKVHFGEDGNTTYLKPDFARVLVAELKKRGTRPFLTDSNTLYRGRRHKSADHLQTAFNHGFTEEYVGAPIVISDQFIEVEAAGGAHSIARSVREADALLVLSHVTGHIVFGYAGALKNISMGFAAPAAKQVMHSDLKPEVEEKKCVGCGTCIRYCPVGAISLNSAEKAGIDTERCVGCGECIAVCPEGAIPPIWKGESGRIAEKSADFSRAVLAGKEGKTLSVNVLIDITPDCDCCDWSSPPFVPDLGIAAGRDIVAVDQASVDLVRGAPLIPGSSVVEKNIATSRKLIPPDIRSRFTCLPRVKDCFQSLFHVDVDPFLEYAAEKGLGSRSYDLKRIE